MKDLSTYIKEARSLKDLKGKKVGKIELGGDGELKISEELAIDTIYSYIAISAMNNHYAISSNEVDKLSEVVWNMWYKKASYPEDIRDLPMFHQYVADTLLGYVSEYPNDANCKKILQALGK